MAVTLAQRFTLVRGPHALAVGRDGASLAACAQRRAQGGSEIATPCLEAAPCASSARASVTLSYESTRTGG